jgi:uncharacterized protein YfaS (alpha-2-macroglobulin family)
MVRLGRLVVFWLLSGCATRGEPLAPPRALELMEVDVDRGAEGPFRVLHAAPNGPVGAQTQLALVFSRPLRALTLAPGPVPSFELVPRVAGSWQWVGTNAVLFVPDQQRFPAATRFRLRVPASLQALDGSRLQTPFDLRFETARPEAEFWDDSPELGPKERVDIFTNQPVRLEELHQLVSVQVVGLSDEGKRFYAQAEGADGPIRTPRQYRPGARVPFRLQAGQEGGDQSFVLLPDGSWPSERKLRFSISTGLAGQEGPLRSETSSTVERTTAGLPVATLHCDFDFSPETRCRPDTVSIELSEPVDAAELERLVQVEPATQWIASAWGLSFPELKPNQRYELLLGAGLESQRGSATPHAQHLTFLTGAPRPPAPGLSFALEPGHIEPRNLHPVLLEMQHVTRYQQAVKALSPRDLDRLWSLREPSEYARFTETLLRGAWSGASVPEAERVRHQTPVDPAPWLAQSQGHGALLFAAGSEEVSQGPSLALIQVSDLALTARLSPSGSEVLVTSLSTLEPLGGAKVTLYSDGQPQATRVSNSRGVARFEAGTLPEPPGYDSAQRLLVQRGDDWSLISLNPYDGYQLGSGEKDSLEPIVAVLVDRSLYRPGDRVYVKGVARQRTPERHRALERQAVDVWLSAGPKQAPKPQTLVTSEFGSFSTSFELPEDAALGSWAVHARVLGKTTEQHFTVSEYRPTAFESQVRAAEDSVYAGELARFTVQGEYLFGQPMASAEIEWRTRLQPASFRPPLPFHYVTDGSILDRQRSLDVQHSALSKTHLDGRGQAMVEVRTPAAPFEPRWLSLEASISDLSRQTHGHAATVLVHPAALYLGLDAPAAGQAGRSVRPKVIAVTPEGRPVVHVRVELSLGPAPPRGDDDGEDESESDSDSGASAADAHPPRVVRCQLVTGKTAQSCSLVLPERGEYFLEARAHDAQGRPVRAAERFTVTGRAPMDLTTSPGPAQDATLELGLDREKYLVGDEAKLTVHSPLPRARAFVTLERHGVLWRTERVIGKKASFTVPVTSQIGRNATVSVLLHPLPPRRSATISRFASLPIGYLYGSVELDVDPNQWRLEVELAPAQARLRPGEGSSIELQVLGSDGQPRAGEVTLWAVDEAVLLLDENSSLDDWLPMYTELRPNTVSTYETRAKLGWLYEPVTISQGGSHRFGEPRVRMGATHVGPHDPWLALRQEPKTATAFFLPDLRTDAQGRVKVPFVAPQSLSRFRIRAMALTKDGEFGSAESQFVTSLPLMLRASLPRFARPEDQLEAGVILTSASSEPLTARVQARAHGLLPLEPDAIRTVTLGPGASQEVRFPWRALAPTTARLEFVVEARDLADGVAADLRVLDLVQKQTVALYGETRGERREALGDLSAADPEHTRLTLTLGSSPLVDVGTSVDELMSYPYSCTEQLTSQLIALGPGALVALHTGQRVVSDAEARRRVLVRQILGYQTESGGFGYWPNGVPSPWLSSYVHLGLSQARALGTPVPERAFGKLVHYLRHTLSRVTAASRRSSLLSQAFLQNALASDRSRGPGLPRFVESLWHQRHRLGHSGQALLLGAMATYRRAPSSWKPRRSELAHHLKNALRLSANQAFVAEDDGPKALLESPDRTTALVLRALVAQAPDDPMIPLLVRGLLAQRRHGTWSSTQASAWALVALSDYLRAVPGAQSRFTAEARLGAERLWTGPLGSDGHTSQSVTRAGQTIASHAPLVFRKQGPGTLFYSARLAFVPRSGTLAPEARGFALSHLIGRLTSHEDVPVPEALRAETEVPLGQPLIGEVQVVVPTVRHHVVVEVPLAAGLEPIDPELTTASPWLRYEDFYGPRTRNRWIRGRPRRSWYDFTLPGMEAKVRRELRDDRILFFAQRLEPGLHRFTYLVRATTAGEFEMPAAHVEEMYQPEHFARGRPVRIRVVESAEATGRSSTGVGPR